MCGCAAVAAAESLQAWFAKKDVKMFDLYQIAMQPWHASIMAGFQSVTWA
jgi:hypothetical protein